MFAAKTINDFILVAQNLFYSNGISAKIAQTPRILAVKETCLKQNQTNNTKINQAFYYSRKFAFK